LQPAFIAASTAAAASSKLALMTLVLARGLKGLEMAAGMTSLRRYAQST